MRIISKEFHRDIPYDIAVLQVTTFGFSKPEEHDEYTLTAVVNGMYYTVARTETEQEMNGVLSEILYANRVGLSEIEV